VNTFDWRRFYEQHGGAELIERLRVELTADYDYVLIDSRTGVSDTSGICTLLLPDAIAACFTLNNQSIEGVHSVLSSVARQRDAARRPIDIYPIPMRIELGETDRLNARLKSARERLRRFVPPAAQQSYWNDVEVLYIPIYSYEETLAAFRQRGGAASVLGAYEKITDYLSRSVVRKLDKLPTEQECIRVLAVFAGEKVVEQDSLAERAESLYLKLPVSDQEELRAMLVGLVKLVAPGMDEPIEIEDRDFRPKLSVALAARDAGLIHVLPAGHATGNLYTGFEIADQRLLRS
jgi:hypothetical protein